MSWTTFHIPYDSDLHDLVTSTIPYARRAAGNQGDMTSYKPSIRYISGEISPNNPMPTALIINFMDKVTAEVHLTASLFNVYNRTVRIRDKSGGPWTNPGGEFGEILSEIKDVVLNVSVPSCSNDTAVLTNESSSLLESGWTRRRIIESSA
jgi:hypothetical protein